MCRYCFPIRKAVRPVVLAGLLWPASPHLPPIRSAEPEAGPPAITLFATAQAAETEGDKVQWTCPMHPHYIASEFGSCPICGMDLVKREAGGAGATTGGAARAAITIPAETMQNMGVRLARAETVSFGRIVRSFGQVAENQRLQTDLTARLEGWVEDLRIRAVGDPVAAGDLLFTLYAPEFIVTQRDYLDATRARDRARQLAIEQRLRAFGMQQQVVEHLASTGQVMDKVPFYAERAGTVAEIMLRPGSYVSRGAMLARIQDYSQVWLIVSVPEKDLGFITVGTPAQVSLPNLPGKELFARVEYVYPTIDAQTRTGQVRLVLDNPSGALRPGAYADVAFEVAASARLAVPSEAILKSGAGRHVVVSLGEGRFEPRAVAVGLTSGRWTEITGEIAPGEEIVVSGQFLIDSESALSESFARLERLTLPLSLLKLDQSQLAMVDHLIDAALYIHEALTDGYAIEPKFLDPAIEIKTLLWPAFQHTRLAYVLDDGARAIQSAQAAKAESEIHASLARLVTALEPWIREGAPDHYTAKKLHLFKEVATGRTWLQLGARPINPYGPGEAEAVMYAPPAVAESADKKAAEAAQ